MMDRTPQVQTLYRELAVVEDQLRPFTMPQPADNPVPLTQEQLFRYEALRKRRDEIVTELAKLEGGRP